MLIRPITYRDKNAWSRMRTELWPNTKDMHRAEIDEYFSGKSIDVAEVLVAENSDSLVGFIELNIRSFAEGSRRNAVPYVEGWFVDTEFRHKGVGSKLMHQAEKWALMRGYRELASDTELENQLSIDIHKNIGFQETERIVCFLKQLE